MTGGSPIRGRLVMVRQGVPWWFWAVIDRSDPDHERVIERGERMTLRAAYDRCVIAVQHAREAAK